MPRIQDVQGSQGAAGDVDPKDVVEAIRAIVDGNWPRAAVKIVKIIQDWLK